MRYTATESVSEKKYLQFKLPNMLENSNLYDLAWSELTDHHLFTGNCTMMILERFYMAYSYNPYENLETAKEDYGEDWNFEGCLGVAVYEELKKLGYKLNENTANTTNMVEGFDGVLLDISW